MSPSYIWYMCICVYLVFYVLLLCLDFSGNFSLHDGKESWTQNGNAKRFSMEDETIVREAMATYDVDPLKIQTENRIVDLLEYALKNKINLPVLTIFTTWTISKEKDGCHNNTLHNWMSLYPIVQPIVFTNEIEIANVANQYGWIVLPVRKTGTGNKLPVLKYMFSDAKEKVKSMFYCYSNSDILFTGNLIHTLYKVVMSTLMNNKIILIVGQRTNVFNVTKQEARTWETIRFSTLKRGKLYNTWAIDFFISSRNYPWEAIPEVVVGRPAFDNWIVWSAKKQHFTTIDATLTLLAVHQTTEAGNLEGHNHTDRMYNRKLIGRHYKRVRWGTGVTSCTTNITMYHDKYGLIIMKRPLQKHCRP